MNPEYRQETIRRVIQRRNPFHANPIVKLRRHGLQRLWHHPRIRNYRLRLATLVFRTSELFSKFVVIITTLFVGFVLATIIIVLPVALARYLLNFNLPEVGIQLITEQSWRNYGGWMLISSTLFCLPYWWWGLPLALTLRYYRPLHHWYTRRRLRAQLQATHCDDPAELSAQITRHPLMISRVQPSQRVTQWLETSGRAVGVITGTLAALLCLILFLKFILFLWHHGELGQSVATIISCPSIMYLPFLVFRSYRSGEAVADLVLDLLRGSSYREAMMDSLDNFWARLFEGW